MKEYKRYAIYCSPLKREPAGGNYMFFNFFRGDKPFQEYVASPHKATKFPFKWMALFYCWQYNFISGKLNGSYPYHVQTYPFTLTLPKKDYNRENCITITEWIKYGSLDFYKQIQYNSVFENVTYLQFNISRLELQITGSPEATRLYCEQLNKLYIPYERP